MPISYGEERDAQVRSGRKNRMAPTRPAVESQSADPKAPPPRSRRSAAAAARRQAEVERKVAEMLRDLQIDGKALSSQIERLRHRFL